MLRVDEVSRVYRVKGSEQDLSSGKRVMHRLSRVGEIYQTRLLVFGGSGISEIYQAEWGKV